jgi:predicted DNA-binding antitoxin AbrB/MazE fold protein
MCLARCPKGWALRRGILEAMRLLGARYEDGMLKPETPLALTPGQRVGLIVVAPPEPRRWDLDRLAKTGASEDRDLAEQGLAEWAAALDLEDRS